MIHHVLSCPYRSSTNLTKTTKSLIFASNYLVLSKYSCLSRNASFQNDSPLSDKMRSNSNSFFPQMENCALIELQNCDGNLSNAHKKRRIFFSSIVKNNFSEATQHGGENYFFWKGSKFWFIVAMKGLQIRRKMSESFGHFCLS